MRTQEVWELVNTATELHNFHLHQIKFRLSLAGDSGLPTTLPTSFPFYDPTRLLGSYEADNPVSYPNIDEYHDVLPVPPHGLDPATKLQSDGRVFVTLPFYAPQQVGEYVFHCHFLDHEDGGMMAPIQVFDPNQTAANDASTQFASLLGASICRVRSDD